MKEIDKLIKRAQNGDVDAQCVLGDYYLLYGAKVKQYYQEAVKWYQIAASKGDARAQNNLGTCYEYGNGIEKDLEEAVKWYIKAAEQGIVDAQYNIASCYAYGTGVELDINAAIKWYQKAAEQGDAKAQCRLGECYVNGTGVEPDINEAMKWYSKAAEQGEIIAQYNLGVCYTIENEGGQNKEEAVKWFQKAADNGNVFAQCRLGMSYANGDGVDKNIEQAIKWYRIAADKGYAVAQGMLGTCYFKGEGVKQDIEKAIKLYRLAAEQKDSIAEGLLGIIFANGEGIVQDKKQSVEWYQKASEHGNAYAQCLLGLCYANGDGVKQDNEQAVKWYLNAAKQGNAKAQYMLGLCYESGNGIEVDNFEAEEWYLKAAEQGDIDSQTKISNIYKEIEKVVQTKLPVIEHKDSANTFINSYYGLDKICIFHDKNIAPPHNNVITSILTPQKYEEKKYAIAFIDLLGTKEKLRQDANKNTSNRQNLKSISKIYEKVTNYIRKLKFNNVIPSWRIFSDNIVIVAPVNNDGDCFNAFYIVFIASLFFQASAMELGWSLRGGIIIDQFYIDDVMVMGNGLVNAYKLESELANNPRIIVSKNAENMIPQTINQLIEDIPELNNITQSLIVTKDYDYYYLNYQFCYLILEKTTVITGLISFLRLKKYLLSEIDNEKNEKTRNKYLWLIKSHNEWCERNHIDHKIEYNQ